MNYTELQTAVEDYCENTFTDTDFATMTKLAEQKIYNSVQLPSLRKNVQGVLTSGFQYLAAPTDFLSVFSIAVVDALGAYTYLLNKDVNFIREAYPTPSSTGTPKYYAVFGPDSATLTELTFILGPTPSAGLTTELHYFYYPVSIVTVSGVATGLQLSALGGNYVNGTYTGIPLTTTTGVGSGITANVTVASGAISTITVASGGTNYGVSDLLSLAETYFTFGGGGGSIEAQVTGITTTNPSGTSWLGDNFDSALFNAVMVEAIRFMKGEADMVALYADAYKQSLTLLKNLGDGKLRQDAYRSGQVRTQVI